VCILNAALLTLLPRKSETDKTMKTGVIIMSIFAAGWWILGSRATGHVSIPFLTIPIVVSTLLILYALRYSPRTERSATEGKRIGGLIGVASGFEGFGIFLAVNILNNTGHAQFLAPVVAIVVGLHFFPIAYWLPMPRYYLSAVSLCLLGIAGFWIGNEEARILFISLGAASILWLTCLSSVHFSRARN
jgi:hypothetical protein